MENGIFSSVIIFPSFIFKEMYCVINMTPKNSCREYFLLSGDDWQLKKKKERDLFRFVSICKLYVIHIILQLHYQRTELLKLSSGISFTHTYNLARLRRLRASIIRLDSRNR